MFMSYTFAHVREACVHTLICVLCEQAHVCLCRERLRANGHDLIHYVGQVGHVLNPRGGGNDEDNQMQLDKGCVGKVTCLAPSQIHVCFSQIQDTKPGCGRMQNM